MIIMGYSQEVKAPVFDTGIPGSNPGTPEHLDNFFETCITYIFLKYHLILFKINKFNIYYLVVY